MSTYENITVVNDSNLDTRRTFNSFFDRSLHYNAADIDAVVGFFVKRGFEEVASISIASVILSQAKADGIPVFDLLDTLKGYDKVQLTNLVAVILNNNRSSITKLGFKADVDVTNNFEARNVDGFDFPLLPEPTEETSGYITPGYVAPGYVA
jgi:hypothetical protein